MTEQDDGDMGDFFRDWNEAKKERRRDNLSTFEKEWVEIFESVEGFKQCSPYHYQFKLNNVLVNYWPSSGKWIPSDTGKKYHGRPKDLLGFIRNRAVCKGLVKHQIKGTNSTTVIVDDLGSRLTPDDDKLKAIEDSMKDPTPPWD